MSIILKSGSSSDLATVDANKQLKVALSNTAAQMGGVRLFSENDATSNTLVSPRTSVDKRLSVGLDTPIFNYSFNANAQNTGIWRHVFTTMTMTQSSGFLNCNAAGTSTVANNNCVLSTWKYLALMGNGSLHIEFIAQISAAPLANQMWEMGLMPHAAAAAAPADGVYFRFSDAGLFGIINYNGTEASTAQLRTSASLNVNTSYSFKVIVDEGQLEWYLNDVLLAVQPVPAANGSPFLSQNLPITIQQRNPGTVGGGTQMQLKVSDVHADKVDMAYGMTFPTISTNMGLMGSQGQDGGTMGGTSNVLNGALAAAAAVSNTAATGGCVAGLGGLYHIAPTLTAGTDGIVANYLNPVGGVNQTPRTLIINGVSISGVVDATLTGGPLALMYSLFYGCTALSLATSETGSFVTATVKAPRRQWLGGNGCVAAAAAGVALNNNIAVTFQAPICVYPGEYFGVAARNMGTVTSAGSIALVIGFDCYWL